MKKIVISLFLIFFIFDSSYALESEKKYVINKEIIKHDLLKSKNDLSLIKGGKTYIKRVDKAIFKIRDNKKILLKLEERLLELGEKIYKKKDERSIKLFNYILMKIYYELDRIDTLEEVKILGYGFSIKKEINKEGKILEILLFKNKEISRGYHYELDKYNKNKKYTIIQIINKVFVVGTFIFEIDSSKLYNFSNIQWSPIIIKKGKSGLFVLFGNNTFDTELYFFSNNGNKKILDKGMTKNIKGTIEYDIIKEIDDFELMTNKRVKIFYTENNVKKEKIIQIYK